jgi:hypothetical protein
MLTNSALMSFLAEDSVLSFLPAVEIAPRKSLHFSSSFVRLASASGNFAFSFRLSDTISPAPRVLRSLARLYDFLILIFIYHVFKN